jgi:cyanophycin synthetase
VVDRDTLACVRQLPAHIVGNGTNTILSLVVQKNAQPDRHIHADVRSFFHPIPVTEETEAVLQRQHYTLADIPRPAVRVWLSDDPFMRNGGDLEEVTKHVHSDNRKLAQDIANLFGMKLVALDLICEDIARSWKEQRCAILELNSLPSIEMHHNPSYGTPQDIAGAIADMALRYYR